MEFDDQDLRLGVAIILAKYAAAGKFDLLILTSKNSHCCVDQEKLLYIKSLNHNHEIRKGIKSIINAEIPELHQLLGLFK